MVEDLFDKGINRMIAEYQEKISKRLWRYSKAIIYATRKPCNNTQPVFIMGCGRSGTTMMINIFHRDHQVEALDENDSKIARNFMLELQKIPQALSTSKASVLIMKPILNSFDASYLLKTYTQSKILWMIRNHRDMIASSMRQFGPKVSEYMKNFVMYGEGQNWIVQGMHMETLRLISNLDTSSFTPYDWMALVWWSVNRTFVLDKLFECNRVFLVRYESVVQEPESKLKSVYTFLGLEYNKRAARYIHAAAIGKGAEIKLHKQVEDLCQDLTKALLQCVGGRE